MCMCAYNTCVLVGGGEGRVQAFSGRGCPDGKIGGLCDLEGEASGGRDGAKGESFSFLLGEEKQIPENL